MAAFPLQRGNTAIELDDDGNITRFTTIYDSFQLRTRLTNRSYHWAPRNRAKS